MKLTIGLLLLMSTLVGCSSTWFKPGATQQDFDADRVACTDAAYRAAPVSYSETRTTLAGQPSFTNCTGGGGSVNCVTTGGGPGPTVAFSTDQNSGARTAALNACMYQRG